MKYADLKQLPSARWSVLGVARILRPSIPDAASGVLRDGFRRLGSGAMDAQESRYRLAVLRCSLEILAGKVQADSSMLTAIAGFALEKNLGSRESLQLTWGSDVKDMILSLLRADSFTGREHLADSDNYRGLLLSLADDIRVVIAMIVQSLARMRLMHLAPSSVNCRAVSFEAGCLYAQLAHRLGLYALKSELEDLSLKFTNRDIYRQIASKLNQTKASRDAYIERFIGPVSEKLRDAGLKFTMKGRTKSISSIWNKIRNKKVDINHIYDLFAVRVILDSEPEREKSDCWLAYSIVADMYTANPARMRDWISIPKGNGYESLHATVLGPEQKWVEVQIRTRRMDLVAEKGLAAHWKYKGGKTDPSDKWMRNIRDILETAHSGPLEMMKDMKMSDAEKEVFVFTPKGDLLRLNGGSTVLDFAFAVHSGVGSRCTGAIVNGRQQKISYRLRSGDTVEISTSTSQKPKPDWLNIAVTSKARSKIRQSLDNERRNLAKLGKETIERRMRNRKEEYDEAVVSAAILRLGYQHALDFYADVAQEKAEPSKLLNICREMSEQRLHPESDIRSASEFRQLQGDDEAAATRDTIVIGDGSIGGLQFRMARCCNPAHGDEVFGFISSDGSVKIHRMDCPNAPHMRASYPYRFINARWPEEGNGKSRVEISVTGRDDLDIVTTVTSLISRQNGISLRSISVDTEGGLFSGTLALNVDPGASLNSLLKKISTLKGIKNVRRIR